MRMLIPCMSLRGGWSCSLDWLLDQQGSFEMNPWKWELGVDIFTLLERRREGDSGLVGRVWHCMIYRRKEWCAIGSENIDLHRIGNGTERRKQDSTLSFSFSSFMPLRLLYSKVLLEYCELQPDLKHMGTAPPAQLLVVGGNASRHAG